MSPAAWIAIGGIFLTLLAQFAGIVWFAASQKTMLLTMQQVVAELKEAVRGVKELGDALHVRVALLEDREERRVRHTDV